MWAHQLPFTRETKFPKCAARLAPHQKPKELCFADQGDTHFRGWGWIFLLLCLITWSKKMCLADGCKWCINYKQQSVRLGIAAVLFVSWLKTTRSDWTSQPFRFVSLQNNSRFDKASFRNCLPTPFVLDPHSNSPWQSVANQRYKLCLSLRFSCTRGVPVSLLNASSAYQSFSLSNAVYTKYTLAQHASSSLYFVTFNTAPQTPDLLLCVQISTLSTLINSILLKYDIYIMSGTIYMHPIP